MGMQDRPAATGKVDAELPGASAGRFAVLALTQVRPGRAFQAFLRLARGPRPLLRARGALFAKMLGSGVGGGFLPWPSLTHQGLFATFTDRAAAEAFIARDPTVAAMRADARADATGAPAFAALLAEPTGVRGRWAGREPLAVVPDSAPPSADGPVLALTRASIRPAKLLAFWRHAPPAQRSLHGVDGCLLAAGLGEAPVVRQCTVTLWRDHRAMAAYARTGAHGAAIRASAAEAHFSESLFARFRVLAAEGVWKGRDLAAVLHKT
jgi:spheroidene monooxygenase